MAFAFLYHVLATTILRHLPSLSPRCERKSEVNVPSTVDATRLRLIKPRLLPLGIESHDQCRDAKWPRAARLRIPLLHAGNILGDVLDADRILDSESVALCFQPRLVHQDPCVSVQTGEGEGDVVV